MNKNLTIALLVVVTILLAGGAVLIADQLGKSNVNPDDTSACISCGGGCCSDGFQYGGDQCAPQASCGDRERDACDTHGGPASCPDDDPTDADGGSDGDSNCAVTYSGGCVRVSASCGSGVTCTRYTGPANSGSCSENNRGTFTVGPGGSACVNPSCGQCEQIDCSDGGGQRANNNSACPTNPPTTTRPPTTTPTTTAAISDCGDSCSVETDCPTDHACVGGSCVLDECVPAGSGCTNNGCTPPDGSDCGGYCASNDDCPNDHVCSPGNICVLPVCLTPGACSDNSCTPVGPTIPDTALVSDEVDRVIFALIIIVFGIMLIRVRAFEQLISLSNYLADSMKPDLRGDFDKRVRNKDD